MRFLGTVWISVAERSSAMDFDELVELLFQLHPGVSNLGDVGNDEIGPTSFGFQ